MMTLRPVAFAAMLCLPAFAYAQTAGSPATAPAAPAAGTPPAASGAATTGAPAMTKDIQAKVEAHIKQLHNQLKITQAQEADWKKFADVMRTNAADMQSAEQQREQQYPSMNALQNMQSYQKLAQTHAEHLDKLASAFETLYNSLPAQQKQAADQAFRARTASQPQHASAAARPSHAE
ncbi:MAG TPA: Spy/CpxP family protein refolding chaperone [Stellaceae bacterium]|jgi:hypothetical protein|nr:Spy/CpxP family protein refolding chaperone [Stellaceae bacterium]